LSFFAFSKRFSICAVRLVGRVGFPGWYCDTHVRVRSVPAKCPPR
jgi:hypothetical protein